MKNLTRLFTAAACALALASCSDDRKAEEARQAEEQLAAHRAQARIAVLDFGAALKRELKQGLQDGDAVDAIRVCNLKAPEIAAKVGSANGLEIGRTSHKARNAANRPDAWEQSVLTQFLAQAETGADLSKLEFAEIVDGPDGKSFRYMKAIPTGALCLLCHGTEIGEDVVVALDELYPQDQARGFKEGDLRGAFTVTRPLE